MKILLQLLYSLKEFFFKPIKFNIEIIPVETFEEALKLVEEKASVYWGTYRVENLVNDLQETYAPKIKMTSGQKSKLMMFIYENEEFEVLWYRYGYGGELYKEFSKKELMQAWLHPELIEVVE